MKISKKIILGSLLIASNLYAEVTTILPYVATLDYTNNANESAKKDGLIGGIYYSYGNLDYLFEMNYSHTNINYKDSNFKDLKQDDFTIAYSGYDTNWKYKAGYHYVSSNDNDLGDGHIFIVEVGGYQFYGYDKFSYGLEGYYSIYNDGHDENNIQKTIDAYQFTPYIGYSKAININTRNDIEFKLNYIIANDYEKDSYTSYEIKDILYYKSLYITLRAYGGKMKTGVKDGGFIVYNTKDLYKDGYSVKLGYFIDKNFSVSARYGRNNFEEFGMSGEASNDVALFTLKYSY